jgi:hypothetical protein
MRYLIDEDLSTEIAVIARGLGLDVVSVQGLGRRRWSDHQQLTQAPIDGRCVVTANRDEFRGLTTDFALAGRAHNGVLILPFTLRSQSAAAIAHALTAFDRVRGNFPFEYVCDFLLPAEHYET